AQKKEKTQIVTPPHILEAANQPGISRQLNQSKIKRNREASKCYRENEVLKTQLKSERNKTAMYRMRYERLSQSKNTSEPDTPRTKTRKLLRCYSRKSVRKTLTFHHALLDQLRHSYKQKSEKKAVATVMAGKILRKYKHISRAKACVGVCTKQGNWKRSKQGSLSARMQSRVQDFFERDDVSRMTTGQKRTVTKHKLKKQKRLLNDTIYNQYRKFKSETKAPVSFITFWRLKPFWVKSPTPSERETAKPART
ncbi:MAG: hypothetical protein ABW168_26525, partial [Sedimenticola sp.]